MSPRRKIDLSELAGLAMAGKTSLELAKHFGATQRTVSKAFKDLYETILTPTKGRNPDSYKTHPCNQCRYIRFILLIIKIAHRYRMKEVAKDELKDDYILTLICKRTVLKSTDIPKEYRQAYRDLVVLKRTIKTMKRRISNAKHERA